MAADAQGDPLGDRSWPRSGNPCMDQAAGAGNVAVQTAHNLCACATGAVVTHPSPTHRLGTELCTFRSLLAPYQVDKSSVCLYRAWTAPELAAASSPSLLVLHLRRGRASHTNWPQGRGGIPLEQRTPGDKWASRTPRPPQRREPTS